MTKEEIDKLFEQSFFEFKDENSFTCMSFSRYKFAELVAQHEREQWPAEMEAMERQVNILTDELATLKVVAFNDGYSRGIKGFMETILMEREECAKICETYADIDTTPDGICDNYHAYLIRARSKE